MSDTLQMQSCQACLQVSPLLAEALQNCVSALYDLLQLVASPSELASSKPAREASVAAAEGLLALLQVCNPQLDCRPDACTRNLVRLCAL